VERLLRSTPAAIRTLVERVPALVERPELAAGDVPSAVPLEDP
jgi:hypothetical protein